jgi:hypothetical protein
MRRRLRAVIARAARRIAPRLVGDRGLAKFARENIVPLPLRIPDDSPFLPPRLLSTRGVDLNPEKQLSLLDRWRSRKHQELFAVLRHDPEINTNVFGHGQAAVHNGLFPTPDAEAYAAMILDRKPRRIVEVGSGFSTRVARAAVQFAQYKTEIVVIDPAPRADVSAYADRVILSPVESSEATSFSWTGEDMLFIDSSHVCRIRGDLPFLYCEVLPTLPTGTVIHVHDIFLPYDYASVYDERCYNEQYLLHCTLSHTPRYRTLLACHWLSREHGEAMRGTFGALVGRDPLLYGASYWMEVEKPGRVATHTQDKVK